MGTMCVPTDQTAEHDAQKSNHRHSQIECGQSSTTETILIMKKSLIMKS